MTSQADVIRAFLSFENSPSRASNMKIWTVGGGHTAYLVGGRNGEEMIIARREPLRQVYIYGRAYGAYSKHSLYNRGGYNQIRKVKNVTRRESGDVDATVEIDGDTTPIRASENDELQQVM